MNEKETQAHSRPPQKKSPPPPSSYDSEVIELNLNLPRENDDDGITLRDIFTIFRNGLPRIIVFTSVFILIGIVSAFVYYFATSANSGTVTGIISFNYKGAESGLDPYGRELDVTKIKSANIIDKALVELGLYDKGILVEDIRQNIVIEGIIPNDAMERILVIKEIATKDPTKLDQLLDVSYIPTQYSITLKITKKLSGLKGAKGVELLNAIFDAYKEYFYDEYTDKAILSTAMASIPLEDYDYDDAARVLNEQLNNIISYLSAKRNEASDFRATSTQMSFGDLVTNLDLLRSINLANIRSMIQVNLLTKDRAQLITTYQYIISQKELERDVQIERARITKESAENYQKDSAIIFSGSGSTDSGLQVSQASDTYDSLIRQSAEASESAIRLQSDIDYYQKRLDDFQNGSVRSNSQADITKVESLLESLTDKMKSWTTIINTTVDEYMEVLALKDAAKIVLIPHYTSSFRSSLKMMGIIGLGVMFVGFVLGIIAVFGKSMMSTPKPVR